MQVLALLFDLDGTLLDSAPDLVAALNHVRKNEGLEPVAVDQLSRYVSRGAVGMLQAGMPTADPETFERWKRTFLDHYAQHCFFGSRLYDGVGELLDFLEQSRIPWGIVTNKSERFTHPVLEASGLGGRASCVVCGNTLARSKPDPAPVRHACAILKLEPCNVMFAGDDVRDIEAGRAAGTQVAAICYGYGSAELSDDIVGDSLKVHHPGDLALHLKNLRRH